MVSSRHEYRTNLSVGALSTDTSLSAPQDDAASMTYIVPCFLSLSVAAAGDLFRRSLSWEIISLRGKNPSLLQGLLSARFLASYQCLF
jgi:hypothetical protein